MNASLDYIKKFQPAIVFLEQVYRKPAIEMTLAKLREFGIHDVEVFMLDNKWFWFAIQPTVHGSSRCELTQGAYPEAGS